MCEVAVEAAADITERRADDATREVEAWLKCEFLQDRVGEVFGGVITAVTAFGVFVELQDLYIEGLVHISALPGDYYHFDAPRQRLVGKRTRQTFQLGGAVRVSVARVDLDERKIDLELEGRGSTKLGSRSGSGSKPSTGKARKPSSGGKSSASAAIADRPSAPKTRAKSKAPKSGKGSPKKPGRRQKKK